MAAAIAVGISLLLVGSLAVVARDAPSTAVGYTEWVLPVDASAAEGCTAFGEYWLDSVGLEIEPAVLEGFTNCVHDGGGEWSAVDGAFSNPQDGRTPEEVVLITTLLNQMAMLDQSLPDDISGLYDPEPNPVIGNLREGITNIDARRSAFSDAVRLFAEDPDHVAFSQYASWALDRRKAAYDQFYGACSAKSDDEYLGKPCRGMEDNLSINYTPWLWDLRSRTLILEYLEFYFSGSEGESNGGN